MWTSPPVPPPTLELSDLHKGAWFLARGVQLLGSSTSTDGRIHFVFEGGPKSRQAESEFANNASIPIQTYLQGIGVLKGMIEEKRREQAR